MEKSSSPLNTRGTHRENTRKHKYTHIRCCNHFITPRARAHYTLLLVLLLLNNAHNHHYYYSHFYYDDSYHDDR